MAIDVNQLIEEMKDAVRAILGNDISSLEGFSNQQMNAIALQATIIETGIIENKITDETRDFFLNGLKDMVYNFLNTLQGLVMVEIEKLWNAIVKVLWIALEKSTGLIL